MWSHGPYRDTDEYKQSQRRQSGWSEAPPSPLVGRRPIRPPGWLPGPPRSKRRQSALHGADADPDPICLSYTHDPDYGEFKPFPPGKAAKPESRKMHLARYSAADAAAHAAELKAKASCLPALALSPPSSLLRRS